MATVDPTKVPPEVKEKAVKMMLTYLEMNGLTEETVREAYDQAGLVIREYFDGVFGVTRP